MDPEDEGREYRVSTHERCSNPCPQIRERVDGSSKFEYVGMWGPFVESREGETLAEGHEEVLEFVDRHLENRPSEDG